MIERLIELTGLIYDAAIDPSGWKPALESIADCLHADSTAMQVQFEMAGFALSAAGRFPLETLKDYSDHYVNSDPRFRAILARGAGRPATSEMLVPMRQFRMTEVYSDFFAKWDLPFVVGGLLFLEPGKLGMFIANRSKNHGDFGPAELESLGHLFPHLRRALEIQSRFGELNGEKQALIEVADRLSNGIILVDERMKVIEANQAARKILDQRDGLSLEGGMIRAARSDETLQLRQLIGRAINLTFRRGFDPAGAMRLPRPSLKRDLAVLAAPLTLGQAFLSPERPVAVIFISDPEEPVKCSQKALREFFDLTMAEARLAALLVEGLSLRDAAALFQVSYQTVRNQLKVVFQKTGVSSQSQLVQTLLRIPAPLSGEELP